MLSGSWETVYFNKSNVIEILIIEVNMNIVFYYTRIIQFIINIRFGRDSILVFSNVQVELRTIESCSSNLNFSSGSNLNSDGSSIPSDIA